MMETVNVLRLGQLVCALGLIVGCGGGQGGQDLRELESIGLVTAQDPIAFFESYDDIYGRLYAGDVEVADVLVRVGMVEDVGETVRRIGQRRTSDNSADIDRAIDILQAADPVAATRQNDEEAMQLALDRVLSGVPPSYHETLTELSCATLPAVVMAVCFAPAVQEVEQMVEPPSGPRRQFGVWVRTGGSNFHIAILEAAGGAIYCERDNRLSGTFNDDGSLTIGGGFLGGLTAVVQESGGVEYLQLGMQTYQRVTEPSFAALNVYLFCQAGP